MPGALPDPAGQGRRMRSLRQRGGQAGPGRSAGDHRAGRGQGAVPRGRAPTGTARWCAAASASSPGSAPAPPIPTTSPHPSSSASEVDGIDMVTVVSEGIFSYCGLKVKIDTDRFLGPEQAAVRADGEQIGHVTTAEYGSQMLSLGGVRHLTGGSKREGNVTCQALLRALQPRAGRGHDRRRRRGHPAGRPAADRERRRARSACGSAAARRRSAFSPSSGRAMPTR